MFENLTDKFERAFKVLKGHGQITEINVAETLKEVRRALLDADVNFKTAKDFTNTVKEKALGRDVLKAVSPGQLMVKICHEELVELMGGNESEINIKGNPGIILMSGLQGSGKTTFSGKLANYLKTKKGKNVLLVACDVYRPAAIDQLHVVGDQIGSPTWTRDLAGVIVDHGLNNYGETLVHAVSSSQGSWFDFATEIQNAMSALEGKVIRSISTEEYPTPAKRPAWSVLDNSETKGFVIGDWRERWKVAAPIVLKDLI